MMDSTSKYQQHLKISRYSARSEDVQLDTLDLFVSFVSWEERSVEISNSRVHANNNIIYRFSGASGNDLKDSREQQLIDKFRRKGIEFQKASGPPSTECNSNFENLARLVRLEVQRIRRPLNLLLDVSCCPKSMITFLIGFCLSNGLIKSIQLFYAHTKYELKIAPSTDNEQPLYRFTDGVWSAVQIPYFEGIYRPSALRKLIVMMGAEISTTESFLRRYQPDKLNLIAPRPGVTDQIDDAVRQGTRTLMRRLEIPEENLVEVAPHDAMGTVVACKEFMSAEENADVTLVCLGTKPHAIGAAAFAATVPEATLVCRAPKFYDQSPGKPTGHASVYRIDDLSII